MPLSETIHGTVRTRSGREVELHSRVGEGGEGSVFHVGGQAREVAKLYNEKMDAGERAEKAEKLAVLVDLKNEKLKVAAAWPTELLVDSNGSIIGFTMEYLTGYQPLFMAYQIKTRLKKLQGRDYGFLVRVASNLAACVHFVHEANLVIGDLNESNVLVTAGAMVKLIDADSFQVESNGRFLTPGVAKTELLPPELQGHSLDDRIRTPEEDRFALAVLIFQTLVFGRHPYAGRPREGGDISLETAIEHGWYVFDDKECPLSPPPNMEISFLPPSIRQMFSDAFSIGRKRPTAEEWHLALREFENDLVPCESNTAHLHWKECEQCPWCDLEKNLRVALFSAKRVTRKPIEDIDAEKLIAKLDAVAPPALEPTLPEPTRYLAKPVSLSALEKVLSFGTLRNLSFVYVFIGIQIVKGLSSVSGIADWALILVGILVAFLCIFGMVRPAWLKFRMRDLSRRYDSLGAQWKNSASVDLFEEKKSEYREIVEQLRNLDARREKLKLDALRIKYGNHLDSYLSRYSLAIAEVPAANRESLDTLIDRGIRTAADVSRPVVQNILSKQSPLIDSLSEWVAGLEMQFWNSSSHPLDAEEEDRIEEEIYRMRSELVDRLKSAEESLASFGKQLQRNQSTLLREYETFAGDYAIQRARLELYTPTSKEEESQSLNA